MDEKKDGFVIYSSYAEKFEDLTDEQFGRLMRIVCEYEKTGETPKIEDKSIRIAFKVIKYELDANGQKYETICEKRKKAIQARWEKKTESEVNTNDTKVYKSIQVNTNDTDKDKDKDKDKENIINDIHIKSTHTSDCKAVASAFNDICTSFPKIQSLTDTRKRLIKKLLEKYSFDEIREVFLKAERADFLKGNGEKGWKANFDWIVKEGNFVKIKEGNYDGTITTKRKEDCINDRSEYGNSEGLYESFAAIMDDAKS